MANCRFELKIKNTKSFQCAVHDGPNGWAYRWKHDGLHDPCEMCTLFIAGAPLIIQGELPSNDFLRISGGRIREEDWEELQSRDGYDKIIKIAQIVLGK